MQNRTMNWKWWLTLTLLNTVILCVSGFPVILTDPIPQSLLSVSFYSLAYTAQNFLFSCLLGIFLLPIFLWVKSDRLKMLLSVLPVSFLLFISYMNAKVFAFWRIFIDNSVLQLYAVGGSQVFEMSHTMVIWIFLVGGAFLLSGVIVILLSKKLQQSVNLKFLSGLFIFIYIIAQSLFIFLMTQDNMRLLQYTIKIPYFYDTSWANALQKMNVTLFPKNSLSAKLQKILSQNKKLNYPLHPLQYHLPQHPLNVLLIVIDTLRYDMVNPINMPNVYRFAQHSDQFLDNLSGGDCTRPGIFSLFYSIPATYWNAAMTHHQGSILIRAFQANHYQLGLYASAPLTSPPFEQTVFATVKNLQTMTPGKTPIDRDDHITREMQNFLNHASNNHQPFFGFMFYDAAHAYNAVPLHHPFDPIGTLNYFSVNNETPVTPIYNLYKNAAYVDDQLVEKVLTTLAADHLSKNTVVIITADHGQEFNEYHNDYWEHASGFSKYQMRTPMIIAWPNQAPAVYHYTTTHFDLAPTLLKHVLGVTNPVSDYSIGDDFFSKKQDDFVIAGNYSYFALITRKTIMPFYQSGFYRLTNLEMKPLHDEKVTPSYFMGMVLREMTAYYQGRSRLFWTGVRRRA